MQTIDLSYNHLFVFLFSCEFAERGTGVLVDKIS